MILIGQWPNLLTFRGGDHASATPLESDKMATRAKKAKMKSRYRNTFKTEWSAEFPGIVSSDVAQSSRKMRVMTSRVSYKDICFHSLCNFVA